MADEDETTLEVQGMDKLLKALKKPPPIARMGILGEGNNRSDKSSNAEIAAVHEYGAPARGLPARSFLRIPLQEQLNKKIQDAGLLEEKTLKEVIKHGSVIPWVEKVMTVAKAITLEAFSSGGFGKWAAWKNPNYINNSGMVLVDTTQLRDSITTEVKEGS